MMALAHSQPLRFIDFYAIFESSGHLYMRVAVQESKKSLHAFVKMLSIRLAARREKKELNRIAIARMAFLNR